jgi:uncharacterized protein
MEIKFRPHHFLCALCFQGNGYSPAFVDNFHTIMAILNSAHGNNTPIQIVSYTDSICDPCPHRAGTACATEKKIASLDKAHAAALHMKPGETITWNDAKNNIAEKMSLETFHHICASCDWKKYGICEAALKTFLAP